MRLTSLVLLASLVLVACPKKPDEAGHGEGAAAAHGEGAAGEGHGTDSTTDPTHGHFTLAQALEGLEGTGKLMARIETSTGTMVLELFEDKAPNTVANFVGLARGTRPFQDPTTGRWVKRPFYDGLTFHRLIPNFMIQGGDPLGKGTGGPGYKFADEINPDLRHDRPGVLSMANAGPVDPRTGQKGTNGSQFFVTERPTPHLDGRHSVFGVVVEGLEVQKRIARMPADVQSGRPESPVIMQKITIFRNAK